jgi:uncharacterized protein
MTSTSEKLESSTTTDPLAGLHVIDCDAHITEPPDLWASRAPASLAARMPEQRTVDGTTAWYLDGAVWAGIGGNTIQRGHEKVLGTHIVQPFADVDPAAWNVGARLALLDEMGIWAQILYPNGVGFSSNHVFAIDDPGQRTVILQVYNDFLMDLQDESGGRLVPQAMLPVWDMDLTVAEMRRLLDRGATGFTLSDRPELLGLPELPEPYFAPMWDLANEAGAVMNFHIGAGMKKERLAGSNDETLLRPAETSSAFANLYWQSFGPQKRLAILATQMYMSNARIICNLCVSSLFDRYPNLKVVSAESGIGWIPFILEALEYQMDEMVTDPGELDQKLRPREYFADHIFVTFWFEHVGPSKLIEDVGVRNVLIETDIPHPTCLYPGTKSHFTDVLGGLDPNVRRRVLQDNAADIYRITLPDSP